MRHKERDSKRETERERKREWERERERERGREGEREGKREGRGMKREKDLKGGLQQKGETGQQDPAGHAVGCYERKD